MIEKIYKKLINNFKNILHSRDRHIAIDDGNDQSKNDELELIFKKKYSYLMENDD